MSQHDRAERKNRHKHGGDWGNPKGCHNDGTVKAQRKAHQAAAKEAKRARRRADKHVIKESSEDA